MNLNTWTAIREYVQAEVSLALAQVGVSMAQGYGADYTTIGHLRRRVGELQEQVTRMETAVRESIQSPTEGGE